jgi:hypothetical protein
MNPHYTPHQGNKLYSMIWNGLAQRSVLRLLLAGMPVRRASSFQNYFIKLENLQHEFAWTQISPRGLQAQLRPTGAELEIGLTRSGQGMGRWVPGLK